MRGKCGEVVSSFGEAFGESQNCFVLKTRLVSPRNQRPGHGVTIKTQQEEGSLLTANKLEASPVGWRPLVLVGRSY